MKLILAWIVAFVLCTICMYVWPIWIAGILVGTVYLISKYPKRYIIQNLAMNIVYILLWPFCISFLGIAYLREHKNRPIRPVASQPFKLEL